MKIIVDLISENLDYYHQADGIIVNSREYSCCNGFTVALPALTSLSKKIKIKGKIAILNIDRIIEERDLTDFTDYLDKVLPLFDLFIYSDMAVFSYFRKHHQLEKLIFDGKTLIASSFDVNYYRKQGITSFLTNELSLEEIKTIAKKASFALEVYGYHQIFYSRRDLLTLYQEFRANKESLENELLFLKEELRDDFYKIYQGDQGTFIYTPYIYTLFEELLELKDSIDYIRINGMFLEEQTVIKVLDCYFKLLKGELVTKESLKQINANISSGFLMNQSILLKDRPAPRKKMEAKS